MPIGLAAASGGFKLGRSLFQAGKRYVKSRIAQGKAKGFNLTSGGFSANYAATPGQPAQPQRGRAGEPSGDSPDAAMSWKNITAAQYAIGGGLLLLLIMKKK
jgi:hypothetical protein